MHRSASATMMLLRTAGARAARSSWTSSGTQRFASASDARHSLPSATQACACGKHVLRFGASIGNIVHLQSVRYNSAAARVAPPPGVQRR